MTAKEAQKHLVEIFLRHASENARNLVLTQYALSFYRIRLCHFLRMILLLTQDGMEVDDGVIVAATGAMVGMNSADCSPNAKSTLVRPYSKVTPRCRGGGLAYPDNRWFVWKGR